MQTSCHCHATNATKADFKRQKRIAYDTVFWYAPTASAARTIDDGRRGGTNAEQCRDGRRPKRREGRAVASGGATDTPLSA